MVLLVDWVGWDRMDGSPGGVRYRAPYRANNYVYIVLGLLFHYKFPNKKIIGGPTLLMSKKRALIAEKPRLRRREGMVAAISLKLLQHKILFSSRKN